MSSPKKIENACLTYSESPLLKVYPSPVLLYITDHLSYQEAEGQRENGKLMKTYRKPMNKYREPIQNYRKPIKIQQTIKLYRNSIENPQKLIQISHKTHKNL